MALQSAWLTFQELEATFEVAIINMDWLKTLQRQKISESVTRFALKANDDNELFTKCH